MKINLLVEGWIELGHSYAIVNCFQLIHLYKNFKDEINFYVDEKEYYRPEWESKRKMIYTSEYNQLLLNKDIFKPFDETKDANKIDIIYRITYPYNISLKEWCQNIPICVFYTSEFTKIDYNYFKVGHPPNITLDNNYIKAYLAMFKNISFTSPSEWSSYGMQPFLGVPGPYTNINCESERNTIISHGVDTTLFYPDNCPKNRNSVRKHYNVKDSDILLLNIGAMTKNKGIMYILHIMHIIVNKLNKKHYKLLLKGTSDLYQTKEFLEAYFNEFINGNVMSKDDMNYLLNNNIIFTEDTLSFKQIRLLYNAADLYISPYMAEGFNLCCLEALSCGLSVLVPQTGSTEKYINDISNNGGKQFIYQVNSTINNINSESELKVNNIDGNHLLNTVIEFENTHLQDKDVTQMLNYINKNYSWNEISKQLYNLFKNKSRTI